MTRMGGGGDEVRTITRRKKRRGFLCPFSDLWFCGPCRLERPHFSVGGVMLFFAAEAAEAAEVAEVRSTA